MAWKGWVSRVKAEFIILLFLLTMAFPMVFSTHSSDGKPSMSLGLPFNSPYRQRIDWNSHHYDWSNRSDDPIPVIIALDGSQFLGLDVGLQKQLLEAKNITFNLGFTGISARLEKSLIESILVENPTIQIQPDFEVKAFVNTAQTGANVMWNWTNGTGSPIKGAGVVVAIIDTGINYDHPALGGGFGAGFRVFGGYDFYNGDSDPDDDNGHGTHCAGIVGANGTIYGMAPEVSFLAYKVLGSSGSGPTSVVIQGIQRATDPNNDGDKSDHADVISMSLGGSGSIGDAMCLAVQGAINDGVVVTVAAGNDGPTFGSVASPGLEAMAITVGSVSSTGILSYFSSRATAPELLLKPEISAPGESIYSTYLGTSYASMSGTSMATPHVAGAVALILQMHPDWSPKKVKSAILSGSHALNNSFWNAGYGQLWVPDSTNSTVFAHPGLASYGRVIDNGTNITVFNDGATDTFSITALDFNSLSGNQVVNETRTWHPFNANASTVTPNPISISTGTNGTITLNLTDIGESYPEGYYDGIITLAGASGNISIPFGYAIVSRLNVHVIDIYGAEVFDIYGRTWLYNLPSASSVFVVGSGYDPSPPADFLIPSGEYSVHAIGHHLIYVYSTPYLLTTVITVSRLVTRDIYLTMSTARQFVLNLTNEDGNAIWAKDFRMYLRHVGSVNVSYDVIGTDYWLTTTEMMALPKSKIVYISDTNETVGVQISGFSYSSVMWGFVCRNCMHWFQDTASLSSGFMIETSADLTYLLSWEFPRVDAFTDLSLTLNATSASTYYTKYELPGALYTTWYSWDHFLSKSSDDNFWMRRDTQTPINYIFSGLNRKIYVQGVFTDQYYPGALNDGWSEAQYYASDYSHVLHADSPSAIYLPDRAYLTELPMSTEYVSLGKGPYYPSVRTQSSNTTMVLFMPLLRDQADAKAAGVSVPMMTLYWDGANVGSYQLVEYKSRPDAVRLVDLPMATGFYKAYIPFVSGRQVNYQSYLEIGFHVPTTDRDPPVVSNLSMAQRFIPGDNIQVFFMASDLISGTNATFAWRSNHAGAWNNLVVTEVSTDVFSAVIPTAVSDTYMDIKLNVTDDAGNFLQYIAYSASMAQIPILFNMSVSPNTVEYTNANLTTVLWGNLTNATGSPLSTNVGVLLELMSGGQKIAMVMDEYVTNTSRTHNGSIHFEWILNPTELFTAAGQTITINVSLDMGLYQPVSVEFTLTSTGEGVDVPPIISLVSPSNQSIIINGTTIDLSMSDEDLTNLSTSYIFDAGANWSFASPWDISTDNWTEGMHNISVFASDLNYTTTASFQFTIDRAVPIVTFDYPLTNWTTDPEYFKANITETNIANVYYRDNGGPINVITAPYNVSTSGWSNGTHYAEVWAYDTVGHFAMNITVFNLTNPTITSTPGDALEDVPYEYQPIADRDIDSWGLASNASFLSQDANGKVTGTANNSFAGHSYYMNVSCTAEGRSGYQNSTLDVTNVQPIVTSSPDLTGKVGKPYVYNAQHTDEGVGGGNYTLLTTNLTDSTTFNMTTGALNFTATLVGSYWLNITADDQTGTANATIFQNWTVTISAEAPVITNTPIDLTVVWNFYWFDAQCTAADSGLNTWVFNTNATWLTPGSYDATHCNVSGTPTVIGWFWVNMSVNDSDSMDHLNFTLTVTNGPLPTFTSSPITGAWEDHAYSYVATADQPVTWGSSDNVTWATVSAPSVSGIPNNTHSNHWYNLHFSITTMNGTVWQNFTITVANNITSFTTTPITGIYFEQTYYYNASFEDWAEGGSFTNIATNFTSSYSWSNTTGKLETTASPVGSYWFNISASDNSGAPNQTMTQNWTLNIFYAVIFTSSPLTGAWEDHAYSYVASVNTSASWICNTSASWTAWNPVAHSLDGTPDNNNSVLNYFANLTVTTPNGRNWQNFTISVLNNPPVITSVPNATCNVSEAYIYNTESSDEGVGLPVPTYSLGTNFTGEAFDTTTGLLSFTPIANGTYWFNITFDDHRGASNSTVYQNFSVMISSGSPAPPSTTPTTPANPSVPSPISVSFKYVIDGATVHFSDNSYGNVSYYIWNFGDGRGSTQKNPDHTYDRPGIYNVTLTVIGKDNRSYTLTTRIAIEQNPVISGHDGGWNIVLTDTLMLRISAVGSLVLGAIMFASAVYMPSSSFIMTNKGRKVIGVLMVVCGISYYIFIDNSWWG